MEQEVWITLRFKGYADAEKNADKIAKALLDDLQDYIETGVATNGFTMSQPGDVIEVEEEAQIYQTNTPPEVV